ncbi:MAG TPA: MBL fold metallo-hydrolase, partial [Desulfosporosinus sp.]|nr:MBL fold metallo-hydrolase [Desulfosporosinus sp.]
MSTAKGMVLIMKIANGIYMLEISANIMGTPSVINPTLIWDNDTVILIDTGYPGQLPQIREAVEEVGVSFNQLNMVILTHQDIDHVGSLSSILNEFPHSVEVLAHKEEKAYI